MAGTPEQQERFIPPAIRGEGWRQGFSEPGAGSDLASPRLPATRVEGGWEVSGQKIWSTNADTATWCLLLARTDPATAGPSGITYFVLDMRAPGVEVRPIRQNTGYHEYCEVFLDRVHIPDRDVIGEVGQGWAVAQRTLAAERGPLGFDLLARIAVALDRQVTRIERVLDAAEPADLLRAPDVLGRFRLYVGQAAALDAVGAARRALAATLAYAAERRQFGRPIGSFQAYKHRCADAYRLLRLAQAGAFRAALDDDPALVRAAARRGTADCTHIRGDAVQLHGAIGFSWETGLHSWLKRSRAAELIADGAGFG